MRMAAGLTVQWLTFALATAAVGCKQSQGSGTLTISGNSQQNPARQESAKPTPTANATLSRQLSAVEWFSKKNLSAEEIRTVDALMESISVMENKSGSPDSLARWAEGGMRFVALDGENLTNISPILAFKNITTLQITGNRFSQSQIDELLKGLPKLKVLALDKGLGCAANPRVSCIY